MTTAATRMPAIRKELRALLPAWVAAVLAILLTADGGFSAAGLGMVTYLLSACVVGAWAIGHDIHAGTLALFLAQPRSRRDMWLTKIAVLVPVQLSLVVVKLRLQVLLMPTDALATFAIPLWAGLFIAPWLTVVSRRALAGAVFAALIPMGWFVAGDLAQAIPIDADPGRVAWLVFVGGSYLVAAVGAVAGWRAFTRLEVIEGSAGEFVSPHAPRVIAEPHQPTVKRSVVWLLVRKDAHLLVLPTAVAAVFIVGALVLSITERRPPWLTRELYAFTPLYIGLNALLIGAMSSAEERQLGTADWQVMLPTASWVQWLIKVAVTLAIAAVLTLAVPVLVLSMIPAGRPLVADYATTSVGFVIAAFVLTGMYVSSLCRTSLGAFVASLPSVGGVWTLAAYSGIGSVQPGRRFLLGFEGHWWSKVFLTLAPGGLSDSVRTGFVHAVPAIGAVALVAPFAIAVYFAMRNHGSAERGSRRVAWQVLWMVVFLAVGGTAYLGANVGSAWNSRAWNRERRQAAIDGIAAHAQGQVGICVLSRLAITCANEGQAFPMGDAWRLTAADAAFGAVDARELPLDDALTDLLRRSIVDRDAVAASGLVAKVGGPTEINRLEWKRFVGHTHFVGDGNPANITTPVDIAERLYILAMRGPRTASSQLFMDLVRAMPPDVDLTAGSPGWTAWRLTTGPAAQQSASDATVDVVLVIAPDKSLMTVSVLVAGSRASGADRSALTASVMRAIIDTY